MAVAAGSRKIVGAVDGRNDLADQEAQLTVDHRPSTQHGGTVLVVVTGEEVVLQLLPVLRSDPELDRGRGRAGHGRHRVITQASTFITFWGAVWRA